MKWNKPEQKPTDYQRIVCIVDMGIYGQGSVIAFYNKADNLVEDMMNDRRVYDWDKVIKWQDIMLMTNLLID